MDQGFDSLLEIVHARIPGNVSTIHCDAVGQDTIGCIILHYSMALVSVGAPDLAAEPSEACLSGSACHASVLLAGFGILGRLHFLSWPDSGCELSGRRLDFDLPFSGQGFNAFSWRRNPYVKTATSGLPGEDLAGSV